jgi:hypothetical protein
VDAFDMSKFFRCILWCAYFQKSPGHMMKNLNLYLFPGIDNELKELGGVVQFNHIKRLFKLPKRQLETSWDS